MPILSQGAVRKYVTFFSWKACIVETIAAFGLARILTILRSWCTTYIAVHYISLRDGIGTLYMCLLPPNPFTRRYQSLVDPRTFSLSSSFYFVPFILRLARKEKRLWACRPNPRLGVEDAPGYSSYCSSLLSSCCTHRFTTALIQRSSACLSFTGSHSPWL